MKSILRSTIIVLSSSVFISMSAIAAPVIPGFGAGGVYNPMLAIPAAAPAAGITVDTSSQSVAAGSVAEGAGSAGAASALGISTPVLIGSAIAVAAVAAIAIGASSSSGGGSSAPSH